MSLQLSALRARFDIDRIVGGVALIALHEIDALMGDAQAFALCARQTWRARDGVERRRERRSRSRQAQQRRREDRAIRRELWLGLLRDLRAAPRRAGPGP
ncbi:hypothetical protein [Solimonas soli]|uniref:hypothetical protein n=1 Tax=Solimonas soli TaxID=413479 RepID=UPI0004806BCF|nr:hypothetical protein [Solimonas soli]